MRDDFPEVGRDDVELLTVSVDSTWVHRIWAEQEGFEFGLLSLDVGSSKSAFRP